MSEIIDGLVVALREGTAVSAALRGGEAIEGIATAMKLVNTTVPEIDSAFQDIATFIKEGEGGVATIGGEAVSDLFDTALREGSIVKTLTNIGVDVSQDTVANFSSLFESITKSRIPEPTLNAIEVATSDARNALDEIDNAALDEITETSKPSDVEGINTDKMGKYKNFYNGIKSTIKSIVTIGGVVAVGVLLGQYIVDYIKKNSGCFLVTKHSDGTTKADKIRNYSCCLSDKSGVIDHPFDKEIKEYLGGKDICVDKGDCCGGWCSIGDKSKLAKTKANLKSLGARQTLACRKATAQEAMAELAKETGKTVKDIVGGFFDGLGFANILRILVAAGGGAGVGLLLYVMLKDRFTGYVLYGIVIVVAVIVFGVTFYLLRKYNVFGSDQSNNISFI